MSALPIANTDRRTTEHLTSDSLGSLYEWEEGGGEGGGAWYLFHISKLTLPDVSTELNDTFDGAGRRLVLQFRKD